MVKKEVFVCDYCNKQSSSITEGSEFPYVQGWRSLTNFEFKLSSEYRHEVIMKHFCSNQCLLSFIQRFIVEQEDALQLSLAKHREPEKKHISNSVPLASVRTIKTFE